MASITLERSINCTNSIPCIKYDGRQQVNKEEVLAELEHARVLPAGREQDHRSSSQPLQSHTHQTGHNYLQFPIDNIAIPRSRVQKKKA